MTSNTANNVLHAPTQADENLWAAPVTTRPVDATIEIPGSKSLSNRYLILAAMGKQPVRLVGLLRSRDTELMMDALRALGVECDVDSSVETTVTVTPPARGIFTGNTNVFCGLAGTVMRFVPVLALYADGPVHFDGDEQAYKRPMKPVLDGLEQLGASVKYHGAEGFLPFTVIPPQHALEPTQVRIDSSSSSQFISGLLLASARSKHTIAIEHSGEKLPSMPHIRMTMHDIEMAGIPTEYCAREQSPSGYAQWTVLGDTGNTQLQLPSRIVVEPDLSNAAPFAGAALIAGGTVRIPRWPEETTQPGALLPQYLTDFGATVTFENDEHGDRMMVVNSDGTIHGLGRYDMSAAGEIAPSLAALCVLADSPTQLVGIGHLRGHETNRLKALVTEINRIGSHAEELEDGISINPVALSQMHGEVIQTYADHRMATFAAMIGLKLKDVRVVNIATTRKTIPDFPGLWRCLVQSASEQPAVQTATHATYVASPDDGMDSAARTIYSTRSCRSELASNPYFADLEAALDMADKADLITTARFGALDLRVSDKPDHTPVTDADRAVEAAIRQIISVKCPGDDVYGEELGKSESHGRRWILDPIDGTKNFVRGVPVWATLIGLQVGDEIVASVVSAPLLHSRWFAVMGGGAYMGSSVDDAVQIHVSDVDNLENASFSFSSMAGWKERGLLGNLENLSDATWHMRGFGDFWQYMLVAQGAADIAAEPELDLYDMAALVPIVTEAGGTFTDFSGKPGPWGGCGIASNTKLHKAAMNVLLEGYKK